MEASLRARREALGLTALDVAGIAGCSVEVVLRAEFGIEVPREPVVPQIAAAYCLGGEAYLRLALEAAEQDTGDD
jgi:transcriptional regulator with XRE-family HTH domain